MKTISTNYTTTEQISETETDFSNFDFLSDEPDLFSITDIKKMDL